MTLHGPFLTIECVAHCFSWGARPLCVCLPFERIHPFSPLGPVPPLNLYFEVRSSVSWGERTALSPFCGGSRPFSERRRNVTVGAGSAKLPVYAHYRIRAAQSMGLLYCS